MVWSNLHSGTHSFNVLIKSTAAASPTAVNFSSYEMWIWGRKSCVAKRSLMIRPLYPKICSSSPKMGYVNWGWNMSVVFGFCSPGWTKVSWTASLASQLPSKKDLLVIDNIHVSCWWVLNRPAERRESTIHTIFVVCHSWLFLPEEVGINRWISSDWYWIIDSSSRRRVALR